MSSVYKDWCSFRTDPTDYVISLQGLVQFQDRSNYVISLQRLVQFQDRSNYVISLQRQCSFRTDPTTLSVYKDNAVFGHIQLTMSSAYKEPNDSAMSLAVGGCYCRKSDQAYSVMVSLLSVMKQYVLAPYFSALKQKSRPESR